MLYLLRLIAVLGLSLGVRLAAASPGLPLQLDASQPVVDAWPAVTVQADPTHAATLAEMVARRAGFEAPDTPAGNLGRRSDAVWLHLPLRSLQGGRWVFVIGYPPLNRADAYLMADGQTLARHRLGNDQPFSQRPL